MIRSSLTSQQIEALHPTRDDTTEVNQLRYVDYLGADGRRSVRAIKEELMLIRKEGFWDTALTVLTGTMKILGFSDQEINSLCE